MKLSFEMWNRDLSIVELLQRAIYKTGIQMKRLESYNLRTFLTMKYNSQHKLFSMPDQHLHGYQETDSSAKEKKLREQIQILSRRIECDKNVKFFEA